MDTGVRIPVGTPNNKKPGNAGLFIVVGSLAIGTSQLTGIAERAFAHCAALAQVECVGIVRNEGSTCSAKCGVGA